MAFFVNVWMPYPRQTLDGGRRHVVVFSGNNVKAEFPSRPMAAVLGADGESEVVQRVGIVKLDLATRGQGALHLLDLLDQQLVPDGDAASGISPAAANAAAGTALLVVVGRGGGVVCARRVGRGGSLQSLG